MPDDIILTSEFSYDNPQPAIEEISKCVSSVHTWLSQNLLKLNIDKTNTMFVSTKSRIKILSKIVNIANQNIKISSEIKLLGIIIDNTLFFDQHIFSTAKQCNIHIKAIKHIRECLTFQTAHNLALALVISRQDY